MSTIIPPLQPHMVARWQLIHEIMEIGSSYGRPIPTSFPTYPLPEGRLRLTLFGGMATLAELSAYRAEVIADMSGWRDRVLSQHSTPTAAERAKNTAALLAQLKGTSA